LIAPDVESTDICAEDGGKDNFGRVKVVNFSEKEESTCINEAFLLCRSNFKRWLVLPLLSLLTLFIFPVLLYWRKNLQRDWLYSKATSV